MPLIILIVVVIAAFIYILNIYASYKTFKRVSLSITLICLCVLLYSIFGVGGWAGAGLGICSLLAFLGIFIGFVLVIFFPKKEDDTISK